MGRSQLEERVTCSLESMDGARGGEPHGGPEMLIVGKQSPDHMALAPSFLTICEENIKGDDMIPNG